RFARTRARARARRARGSAAAVPQGVGAAVGGDAAEDPLGLADVVDEAAVVGLGDEGAVVRLGFGAALGAPVGLGDAEREGVVVGQQPVGALVLARGADVVEGELAVLGLRVEVAGLAVARGAGPRLTLTVLGLGDVLVALADLSRVLARIGDAQEV